MRKVGDEETKKEKKKKIMTFIVNTNVVASRPPERRLTGMLHARAKSRPKLLVSHLKGCPDDRPGVLGKK